MSEKFLKTIHFDKASGTYNVQLPWKSNKQELPTNFELSKRRLKSLIFTLKTKDPALISKYSSQLMEQLDLGFIEKVQEPTNATVIHYIPHFPVFKDSATTKMRIVYDASAKTSPSALCLNDCLYTGPSLIHSFWKRWQQEYLTGLREQYCKKRKAPSYTVSKGDVVLIHDHIRKRNQWKMGVVTTLYPGKDGLVRSVTLRTSSGQELNRPIEKLYPMEIQEEEEEIAPKDISTIKRPVRLAAVKAAQRIKEQCQ